MSCRFVALRIHGAPQVVLRRTGQSFNPPSETGFGLVQGESDIALLWGSPSRERMLNLAGGVTWSPDALLVQLPDPLPDGPHQIRVRIMAPIAGMPPCEHTERVDLSNPLDDPLLFIVAVPTTVPLDSQILLVSGLPGFRFDMVRHSPVTLNCADGIGSADLTASATGWGTNILTLRLPRTYACDLMANPTSMIRFGSLPTGVPIVILPPAPTAGALEGRFRLLLNGFSVNRETSDHVLEVDGKGDEVFLQAHVTEATLPSGPVTTITKVSKTFGDTNGFLDRVQAGSRSSRGGLRTDDSFGTHARGTLTPTHNELPMVLWEGTLRQGLNGVIVVPIPWEVDLVTDTTLRLPDWTLALGGLVVSTVTAAASAVLSRLALLPNLPLPPAATLELSEILDISPLSSLSIMRDGVGSPGRAGDIPIGFRRVVPTPPGSRDTDQLFPQMVVLTYETALLGSRTAFISGGPNGVFTMRYAGENMNWNEGDYTLFLQIEEVS